MAAVNACRHFELHEVSAPQAPHRPPTACPPLLLLSFCSIRDRLIESWNDTNQHFDVLDVKRVYVCAPLAVRGICNAPLGSRNTLLTLDYAPLSRDCSHRNYLSLEFLMGRSMQNALLNMDLEENYRKVCMLACSFRTACRVPP